MNRQSINVLVVGAGAYVCGRGTSSFGTVLPTLVQAQAEGLVGEIRVASTSRASAGALEAQLVRLNQTLGVAGRVTTYPSQGSDPQAYRKALEDLARPACAIVVTPDHTHAAITADVIRAGVHVLVVKPLTPTVREACGLIELAEAHDVYGAVELHKRFDESNLLLRKYVRDGTLGQIRYVVVEYSQRRLVRELFSSWLHQTNIFQYLGVHYADIIYFATGARPARVLATGQPLPGAGRARHVYDSVQALIQWEGGAAKERFTSTIITNWIDPDRTSAMSDQKIVVVGTQGRYQADQKSRGVQLVTEAGGVEEINPYFTQVYPGADGTMGVHGYGPRSIRRFLQDVADLSTGRCQRRDLLNRRPSFQEALASTAVVEGVNRSLEQGSQWIDLEPLWATEAAMATSPPDS